MVTTKDRGLIAQIAGYIASNFNKPGRGAIGKEAIASDSVDLAILILERVDVVLPGKSAKGDVS